MFEEIKPIVNENIKKALAEGTLNAKVMPGDHIVTAQERERVVFKYDILKKKLTNKIKRKRALLAVNQLNKNLEPYFTFIGIENAEKLCGQQFIITANHYSPLDSMIIRALCDKLGYKNKLSIVIDESNLFMEGDHGKLLKALDVLPYSHDLNFAGRVFMPSLSKLIGQGYVVLVYPEQEMWLDYPFARPLMPGAYHFATKLNLPILPTFTTFKDDQAGNRHYTLHIGTAIYPDQNLSLSENKKMIAEEDYNFKKQFG